LFSEENKPGLLSSDWLTVNRETGEINGDEPVLLTTYLTTTLGYPGSSKTNVVDRFPNEIGSGVDAGKKIRIPDYTGDTWINYDAEGKGSFVPISTIDIAQAAVLKKAVPLPVIVTVTMALEGDLSAPATVGELGTLGFQPKLNTMGEELEATKIYVGTSIKQVNVTAGGSGYTTAPKVKFSGGRPGDLVGIDATGIATLTGGVVTGVTISEPGSGYLSAPTVTFEVEGDGTGAQGTAVLEDARPIEDQLEAVLKEAQDRIAKSLAIKWYEIGVLALQRIRDWGLSVGDPDDPVGLGATILIPVTSDVVDLITKLGGPAALRLDSNYTRLYDFDPEKAGQQDYKLIVPVPGWGATIQVRVGLLVPPGAKNEPQEWTTEYSGAYFGNKVANWTVDTQAWVRTIW
jgi:hypothetical protein